MTATVTEVVTGLEITIPSEPKGHGNQQDHDHHENDHYLSNDYERLQS